MTDERKAMFEDWKNKNKDKIEGVVTTLLSYEKGVDTKTCYDEVDWIIKKAFLAGLEAGRPQWHKVADGDLPKEQKEYACKVFFYDSEKTFNAFLWFDPKTKNFKLLEDMLEIESIFKVKEWCEIPKYMKE